MNRLALIALLALSACSHQPKQHVAPDSTAVRAAQRDVRQHFATAREANMRVGVGLRDAETAKSKVAVSVQAETDKIVTLQPRVEAILAAAPDDMKPQVQALADEVTQLAAQHSVTVAALEGIQTPLSNAKADQQAGNAALIAGEAKAEQLETKYGPAYFAAAEAQTGALNDLEIKYANVVADRDHKGNILGLVCAVSAALACTRFVTVANPYSFGYPLAAFALAYGAGRWLL